MRVAAAATSPKPALIARGTPLAGVRRPESDRGDAAPALAPGELAQSQPLGVDQVLDPDVAGVEDPLARRLEPQLGVGLVAEHRDTRPRPALGIEAADPAQGAGAEADVAPQASSPCEGASSTSPGPRSSSEKETQIRLEIQAGGSASQRGTIAPPMQATSGAASAQRALRRSSQSGSGIASSSMKATMSLSPASATARFRATDRPGPAWTTPAPSSAPSRSWGSRASGSSPLVTSSAAAPSRGFGLCGDGAERRPHLFGVAGGADRRQQARGGHGAERLSCQR